jgi:ribosome-binding protein aMBF1 (putative translation factor)
MMLARVRKDARLLIASAIGTSSPDRTGRRGMVTIAQIKAARALLGWSQVNLAEAAGLSLGVVKHIERGALDPQASQLQAVEDAFNRAGVTLNEPGDHRGEGRGVRFTRAE